MIMSDEKIDEMRDLGLCYVSFHPQSSRDGGCFGGAVKCFGVVFLARYGHLYLPFSREGNSYQAIVTQHKIGFALGDFNIHGGGELYGAAEARPFSEHVTPGAEEERLLEEFRVKYDWLNLNSFTGRPRVICLEPYYLVWARQEGDAMRESRWHKKGESWELLDEKNKGAKSVMQ